MKVVIAGASHSGKTTLIRGLTTEFPDWQVIPEAGRRIIKREQAYAKQYPDYVPRLPFPSYERFGRLVIAEQLYLEERAAEGISAFLDRSLLDTVGYARYSGEVAIEQEAQLEAMRANYSLVLFLPVLSSYRQDTERHESNTVAEETQEVLRAVYQNSGIPLHHMRSQSIHGQRAEAVQTIRKFRDK